MARNLGKQSKVSPGSANRGCMQGRLGVRTDRPGLPAHAVVLKTVAEPRQEDVGVAVLYRDNPAPGAAHRKVLEEADTNREACSPVKLRLIVDSLLVPIVCQIGTEPRTERQVIPEERMGQPDLAHKAGAGYRPVGTFRKRHGRPFEVGEKAPPVL